MEKNTQSEIYNKLYKLQLEIGIISKDVTNPFYKSKYFDINSLIGQLHPLLKKHGLLLLQPINDQQVYSIIREIKWRWSCRIFNKITRYSRSSKVRISNNLL